jgi:hypothetical protein
MTHNFHNKNDTNPYTTNLYIFMQVIVVLMRYTVTYTLLLVLTLIDMYISIEYSNISMHWKWCCFMVSLQLLPRSKYFIKN